MSKEVKNNFEYAEFSKISMHTHLGDYDRTIDKAYGFIGTFDFDDVLKKIKDAYTNKFDLLGMTNSNVILPLEFILTRKLASELDIELVCGIETCIKNKAKKKYLHTVILFPNNLDIIELSKAFEENFKNNNGYHLTTVQLVEILFKIKKKAIIIPHGIKQSSGNNPKSASKNPEQFHELIGLDNSYPVLIEDNRDYHKKRLENELVDFLNSDDLNWIDETASVSAVDRNKDITFSTIGNNATYIWGKNTFNDLYFASLMKKSRIKKQTDIITKESYIHKIIIAAKDKQSPIKSTTIYCSHGLNAIIGKSGSGKTLLLNEINYILKGKNLENKISNVNSPEGYRNICNQVDIKLYDIDDNIIDKSSGLNVFEGENLYNKMLEIFTSDKSEILSKFKVSLDFSVFNKLLVGYDDKLNLYIKLGKNIKSSRKNIELSLNRIKDNKAFLKNNTSSASTIKEFTVIDLNRQSENIIDEIKKINTDIDQIEKIKKWLNSIESKYNLDESHNKIIFENLEAVKKHITKTLIRQTILYTELQIKQLKKTSLNNLINNYNTKLGDKALKIVAKQKDNTESVSTLLNEIKTIYINKTQMQVPIITKKNIEKCFELNNINKDIQTEFEHINLEFKELEKVFPSNIGSPKNALNRSLFNGISSIKIDDRDSVEKLLNIFIENNYSNILSIDKNDKNYISFKIKLKDEMGIYKSMDEMTAGQLGKLYISNFIKDGINELGGNLIVLFDQPENNLEKEYILEDLIGKLDELKKEYQIFITTHEPLLVVNGDANNIILATNPKTVIQPNNINYENLSFVDKEISKDDMIKEIAKLVDGSHNAVRERNRIYGGMLNGN